ncbi:LysR family transcriptional regulator [uncultured Thiothrix sp.]|uniref:LysR family transcriptional regulator n=1 Tax=uncultured Thiothrix sp. TaxID=223185 RepID=UPI00262E33A6|nr:LysR family transcriptional regulator [uncultured Thiothrix sp.]HMT93869.1 LysR family transcriptional regulator [Thiolinea sp.]
MELHALIAFVEVARYQSFSLAADALFLSQPAISKRISALEAELGTALFNRINRKVTLTEAGRALLPRVQALRTELEDIRRLASNLSSDVHGVLTMGTSHHIGLHRLPPALSAFNQRYPAVQLDLRFVASEQACQAVERGELEMAIATLPNALPEQLQAQVIWTDQLHIVTSRQHMLSQRGKVSLAELVQHRCVLPSKDTYTYQIISQALRHLENQLNVYVSTNYLETLKMLVSAGFGWSLLPHTLLNEQLVIVETPLQLKRELGVITHRKRTLSNATRGMLGILQAFS